MVDHAQVGDGLVTRSRNCGRRASVEQSNATYGLESAGPTLHLTVNPTGNLDLGPSGALTGNPDGGFTERGGDRDANLHEAYGH